MKKSLHYCLFFTLFFTACMTPRHAILTPDLPTQYLDNEGFATQKSDNLAVTFGYLYSTRDYLIFEVEVRNNKLDSLTIDPQQFAYRAYGATDSSLSAMPVNAHSFDRVLTTYDDRARQVRRTTTIITLISIGAIIATDVAISKQAAKSNIRRNDNFATSNFAIDLTSNYFDAMIFNTLSRKEARKGLERSFLQPLTIGKSSKHIGTVYFPRNDAASRLTFNFKVGEQDFETSFKQEVRMR